MFRWSRNFFLEVRLCNPAVLQIGGLEFWLQVGFLISSRFGGVQSPGNNQADCRCASNSSLLRRSFLSVGTNVSFWSTLCAEFWHANPKPLLFQTAEAARDGNVLKLLFELRAVDSTYALKHDAATDSLRGVYDLVVAKRKVRRNLQSG